MSAKLFPWIFIILAATISYSYALENAVMPDAAQEIMEADTLPAVDAMPTNQVSNIINEEISDNDFIDDSGSENATIGMASIQSTQEGSNVEGEADFVETADGLSINIEVFNVPNPGKHGIHIHENGSCADVGKAAGSHFNPDNMSHGMVMKDGQGQVHAGDLGNIEITEDGSGSLSVFLSGYSLTRGPYNVAGKAVILHEKEDDFSQPTGNSGGRIGCGIIEVAE